jgi:Fe-S-cluster-containing hydrogenase component 2
MDADNHLQVDSSKCLECMLCIKACPQRIITNIFSD